MDTKICNDCGKEKPSKSFNPKTSKSGITFYGKLCNNCRHLKYQKNYNVKIYIKKIYDKNIIEKKCTGCLKILPSANFHKSKIVSSGLKSRCKACSRKEGQERRKNYTPEKRLAYIQKAKEHSQSRKAKLRKSPFVILVKLKKIIRREGMVCYLCNKPLTKNQITLDHVIPLARGGSHKPENIKIACLMCNMSKHAKTLTEFKKWRGDYDRFRQTS